MTKPMQQYELAAIGNAVDQAKHPLKRSTNFLVGGLLLAGVGAVVAENGRQQQIKDALRGTIYSSGSTTAGWGSILTLLGVIVALIGVARLAAAIDRTAALSDAVFALTLRLEELAPEPGPEAVYDDDPAS